MESLEVIGYIGALAIGLILGLTGSGGSILAVPIFTYLFQINPVVTTTYSLFVVGTSSSVGVLRNFRSGLVDVKTAMSLAIPCVLGVVLVRKFLLPIIPDKLVVVHGFMVTKDNLIMIVLSVLIMGVAMSMIFKKSSSTKTERIKKWSLPLLLVQGTLIGVVTGMVGIGGGFLIVPVLVVWGGMPMKKAVSTSLLIIALKSLGGFLGDVGSFAIDWGFLLGFTLLAMLGILLGIQGSKLIEAKRLKQLFGWSILVLAVAIFMKELIL